MKSEDALCPTASWTLENPRFGVVVEPSGNSIGTTTSGISTAVPVPLLETTRSRPSLVMLAPGFNVPGLARNPVE